ncbi:MAG: class I SAM-dependent methyltransferase [Proteobacteria bacterium]|nr:class I SAM-dependent methyltransferase [Pseudomonadota bacterium]MDA1058360.1 class I SAM-dependent methyltransferase [Pseudomonadota bacterium]
MADQDGKDRVRAHYEALPYPTRDPADERNRLITGSPSHLDEINHYVFGGRLDFGKPFRALVAGGGTGDAAIMLAQHLAEHIPLGHVDYLDLSLASQAVARARAEARRLTNIAFHHGSLTEPPDLGAPFDYIDCCGVLHHLPDPEAGLRTLAGLLRPGGGMGIMVYGALGRTGVYPAQAALRALAPEPDVRRRLSVARRMLGDAPETNWLKRNPFLSSLNDDDSALADLLLHPIDRAYTVPEAAALIDQAGLTLTALLAPARYEPATYLKDKDLMKRAAKLSWIEACALAENLCGNLKIHIAYVSKGTPRDAAVAQLHDDAVPILLRTDAAALAAHLRQRPEIKSTFDGIPVIYPVDPAMAGAVALIDGVRNIGELREQAGVDGFDRGFRAVYRALNGLNLILLRHPAPPS